MLSVITMGEALAGLALGLAAGALIAALLTLRPGLEGGVMTLAILLKSTPMVAVAPLLTLWLGFGVLPKIIITALLTFFPALVNLLTGLQRPDPILLDLFRSWRATPLGNIHPPARAIRPALPVCRPENQRSTVADWGRGRGMDRRFRWSGAHHVAGLQQPQPALPVRGHLFAGRGRHDPLLAGGVCRTKSHLLAGRAQRQGIHFYAWRRR